MAEQFDKPDGGPEAIPNKSVSQQELKAAETPESISSKKDRFKAAILGQITDDADERFWQSLRKIIDLYQGVNG